MKLCDLAPYDTFYIVKMKEVATKHQTKRQTNWV